MTTLFFVLTFALSWTFFIAAVALKNDALVLPGVFGPAIVAIGLTAARNGREAVVELLARVVQWQVSIRWYIFAVAYMVVVKLCVALLYRAVTGSWPLFGHEGAALILLAIVFSTPVQSGEEIGWRGYALPRLLQRLGFAGAGIVLGVIWAAWHLPLFFLPGADKFGQSFPVWALEVTALSVAIAFLYVRTNGSLLLTMLMHSAVNQTLGTVPGALPIGKGVFSLNASLVEWLTAALLWVVALYLAAAQLAQKRDARTTGNAD